MLRLNNNQVRYIDLQQRLPELTSSLSPQPESSFWIELGKGFILAAMMVLCVILLFAWN
jgi:hypothetical protein